MPEITGPSLERERTSNNGLNRINLRQQPKDWLPIESILGSVDFSDHFLILGDVGTGKSTTVPVEEFKVSKGRRDIVIREPSRASCNALYYSILSLHPDMQDDLAVITKDTQINVEHGRVKIVTDGVLLRMLAEDSITSSSVYFDESHQMTSQLELCMSLAKRSLGHLRNLIRVMSATIDPSEFLSFLGISKVYSVSGRRFPVSIEIEQVRDLDDVFSKLSVYLYSQPTTESWIVFLPTRRLVEKYAGSYGGVYIHGGLDGSEINKIQMRAEVDKGLKIFATNVIASSVNIYVDNVLIFNEEIQSRDTQGQKRLEYKTIDNNSLLQMIGRIGRFKRGRAVILTDTPLSSSIKPVHVRKSLEHETPFDLVLLLSKYGLKLDQLEFLSKLNSAELMFAENWLFEIGAIEKDTHGITEKGILMSEIPYEPDFAHIISNALLAGEYDVASFMLASGAFGDSLNHSYRSDMQAIATDFLYSFDKTSELSVKANLLKGYSEDREGEFVSRLISNGIFPRFLDEAWKNYCAALDALNDILSPKRERIEKEVRVNLSSSKLVPYLEDCLSFQKFRLHEKREYGVENIEITGDFFARTVIMNYRTILYDIVAL